MSVIDMHLYRLKLVPPHQLNFLRGDFNRPHVFREVLAERLSVELREGYFWHLGNVRFVDNTGGYFAIGRTTKSSHEMYDENTGNFVEEVLASSPYTHVIFDCHIGFLAIAQKTRLAPTPNGIARKIMKLFEQASVIKTNEIDVSVDPISDPQDFIALLQGAYSIKRFDVTFSRSNPFDADEFFQKPMEKYLDAANGQKGRTIISGKDLDAETLVTVTKSIAATGNDAKALVKANERSRYTAKHLRKNAAHFTMPEEEFEPESALRESREAYAAVRGNADARNDNPDQ